MKRCRWRGDPVTTRTHSVPAGHTVMWGRRFVPWRHFAQGRRSVFKVVVHRLRVEQRSVFGRMRIVLEEIFVVLMG